MIAPSSEGEQKLGTEQRLAAYQKKLRALKERSSLREVMERELLLEFIRVNHSNINEYPLLKAQQKSVVELLCARTGHPGYEYIHKHIANFIVQLARYEKATKVGDVARAEEVKAGLINTETMLIKCVQGIVYAMALITDNFEEVILRYFGQGALEEYSVLIENNPLDERFWTALVEQFIARHVDSAHKEILEGEKYDISKERNFLVIRFLFDDILSKLNPTSQKIEKTRIQKSYDAHLETEEGARQARFIQNILTKGTGTLSQAEKITKIELTQAGRIVCIDSVAATFEAKYQERMKWIQERQKNPGIPDNMDPEEVKRDQIEFKFLMDQVVAVGVGATIAFGRTGDSFFRVLSDFIPEQVSAIQPLAREFSLPTLERILYFLLENHTIHILMEIGRSEGSKVQVRSGRARRVSEAVVDGLPHMSKIRKKKLFGNDVTRQGALLFKAKTPQQLIDTMKLLSLEPELQAGVSKLWKEAVFRVDIMVLLNLELISRTSTNMAVKLGEILKLYGVSATKKKVVPPPAAAAG